MQRWQRNVSCGFGLLAAGAAVAGGGAPVVYVGVGAGCQHVSLFAAVAAAPNNAQIRIVGNEVTLGAPLVLSGRQLRIDGGYASCGAALPTSTSVVRSIAGGGPVLAIDDGGTSFHIELFNLRITGGNHVASGGGIQTVGTGTLILSNSDAYDNQAQDGGGLSVIGDGTLLTTVELRGGSVIGGAPGAGNVATRHGGGFYCSQARVRLGDAHFLSNVAAGDGGGAALVGCEVLPLDEAGATQFSGNRARDGGGIHASAGATLLLSSTPARKVAIEGNLANEGASPQRGGGVYLEGAATRLVGHGVWIRDNRAVLGGGGLFMTSGAVATLGRGTNSCAIGDDGCSRIEGNRAANDAGSGGNGGAAQVLAGAQLTLAHTRLAGNMAGNNALLRVNGIGTMAILDNTLIVGNQTIGRLVTVENTATLDVDFTTLADNAFNGGAIEAVAGTSVALQRSILQVANGTAVTLGAGAVVAACVNTSAGVLGGDGHAPGFVSAATGHYHLSADSQNLDRCAADGNESLTDITGQRRNRDRVQVPDNIGPLDRGAFEDVDQLLRDGFES